MIRLFVLVLLHTVRVRLLSIFELLFQKMVVPCVYYVLL